MMVDIITGVRGRKEVGRKNRALVFTFLRCAVQPWLALLLCHVVPDRQTIVYLSFHLIHSVSDYVYGSHFSWRYLACYEGR